MATKKKSAAKQAMIVIATGDRPIQEVAADLKAAGFEVDGVLDAIGQITGSAPAGAKAKLEKIRGVADVSAAHEDFDIGPPDSPVQ